MCAKVFFVGASGLCLLYSDFRSESTRTAIEKSNNGSGRSVIIDFLLSAFVNICSLCSQILIANLDEVG